MKKAILLATLAIVAIAGCTVPNVSNIFPVTTTVIGGTGMVMTSYAADQSEVYSSQTDRIMMTVSNAGGHLVPNGEALVYLTGSALDPDSTDTADYWTGSSTQIQYFAKDMKPADPIRDVPADEKTFTWSYISPNISRGQQNSYLFIGRVYYDYQTKVTGNIWIYTQDEADAQRAAGKSLQTSTWSATSGPIAVVAKATQDPVVLYGTESTITLVIKVSNAGGGVLYQKGAITGYGSITDPAALTLTSDELNRVTIGGTIAGDLLPDSCRGAQELVGGKPLTLTCDVTIDPPTAGFQGLPITITADYGYYTEQSTSVTVSGR